jgi:hypothetical protein
VESLAYLRPDFTGRIEAREPVEDGGARFDRLVVTASHGTPAEIWIDADGLTRREIVDDYGSRRTTVFAEYGTYDGVRLPRSWSTQRSTWTGEEAFEATSVEFPATLDAALFAAPTAHFDVSFPKDVTSVRMPLAVASGRVRVQARLGGRQGTFILDNGADMTVVDRKFLATLGVATAGNTAPSAGALSSMAYAAAPSVEVGGVVVGPQTVQVADLGVFGADGILGFPFLAGMVTTIDYPGGWLTFAPAGAAPSRGAARIPFVLYGHQICLPVSLDGEPAGAWFFDIGNDGYVSAHHAPHAAALVPTRRPLRSASKLAFGTGAAAAFFTHANLGVGAGDAAIVWPEAPMLVMDPADPAGATLRGDGNLGYSWLSHFVVTIDYGRQEVRLARTKPFRRASAYGVLGYSLTTADGHALVDEIAPGWAADRAGLRVGDEIVAFDGLTTWTYGDEELSPGELRVVHVRRGDEELDIRIYADRHP